MRLLLLLATCQLFSGVLSQKPELYPVVKNEKYGYIDSKGKLVIPYQYTFADEFNDNGLAYAANSSGSGMIDAAGKTIVPFGKYLYVTSGMDGLVYRRNTAEDEKPGELFDKNGKKINIPYAEYHFNKYPEIAGNNIVILVHGYQGVSSLSGQIVLPAVYDDIRMFDDGILSRKGDTWFLFNHNGKFLFSTKYDMSYTQWNGNMITFKSGHQFGMYNLRGEEVVAAKYQTIDNLNESFASVEIGSGLEGYMDSTGKVFIEPKFKRTGKFYNGYACVSEDGDHYGLIDLKGNWVIQPKYENPFQFKDNVALVSKLVTENKLQHMLIDISGKVLSDLTTGIGSGYYISFNTYDEAEIPKTDEYGVFSIETYMSEVSMRCEFHITKQGKILHKSCFANECFPAGSSVYMGNGGCKNIEDIHAGDTITSYSNTSKCGIVKDVEVYTGTRSMVQIDFHQPYIYTASLSAMVTSAYQSISSTATHPFYTTQGIKNAGDLKVGDHIFYINPVTHTQTEVEIKAITISEPKPVKVYNIKTDASGYVVNGIAVAVK